MKSELQKTKSKAVLPNYIGIKIVYEEVWYVQGKNSSQKLGGHEWEGEARRQSTAELGGRDDKAFLDRTPAPSERRHHTQEGFKLHWLLVN